MAPAIQPASEQIQDPLLTKFDGQPSRDWVRRLAGWRGPSPPAVARVFLVCVGITALLDYRAKYLRALRRGTPAEPSVVSFAAEAPFSLASWFEANPKATAILGLTAFLVIVLVAVTLWSRRWAQKHAVTKIYESIAHFDQEYIGAEISFHKLIFNLWTGRLFSQGVSVHNPIGFKGSELMKAEHFNFGVELRKTFGARGKKVYLSDMRINKVTFKIESDSLPFSGKTNLDVLLEHMADGRPSAQQKAIKEHEITNYDAQLVPHDEAVREEEEIIILKTVQIMNITIEKEGTHEKFKIPNITYEHFAEEDEHDIHTEGACHLDDLVYVLMKKLCTQVSKELEKKNFV